MTLKLAVIGAGRMGKLHARVLSEMPEVELVGIADVKEALAASVAAERGCRCFTNAADLVEEADAAVIAVPTVSHMAVARPFVAAGKGVLIEKPLADDLHSAQELIALAKRTRAVIQVGHAERYNPAVIAMAKYAIKPKFIESHRISPYTFRSVDVGVVLDMMIHDIDIVLMLAGCDRVTRVEAVAVNVIGETEDIANARVTFANGCVANITASRLAIKSERKMRVFSEEAYLSVDYQANTGMVVRKSKNLDLIQMALKVGVDNLRDLAQKIAYTNLVKIEQLVVDETTEPLRRQAEAFVASLRSGTPPAVSAEDGFAAMRLAKMITDAAKRHQWDGVPDGRVGMSLLQDE
ncbi:MAG: Gfo/Idh/MocA family oxidoreductase [Planctomycetes bacterium]|nr:Gfo/Idh/MocA family oxidoreductase [Planctomycetota bacterium]